MLRLTWWPVAARKVYAGREILSDLISVSLVLSLHPARQYLELSTSTVSFKVPCDIRLGGYSHHESNFG
jgi:hypothetical protein